MKTNRASSRMLSLLLAVLMVLAILPINASAVDADKGSFKTVQRESGGLFTKSKCTQYYNPATVDQMLQDWIAAQGVTPENSLGLDEIVYQYWDDGSKARCDTGRWAQLAHEICPEAYDSLDDSVKVLLLHDWMTENLAYDYYLFGVLQKQQERDTSINAQSRNFYYKDHTGKYSVWNTRTGVCLDFSNILTIMCRELGIPCNVMSNKEHVWNLVWLNGRWHVFDLTGSIQRKVYGADTSKIDNADDTVNYDGFDILAKDRFGRLHSLGNYRYSLDKTSIEKWRICINRDMLYTKESLKNYISIPPQKRP